MFEWILVSVAIFFLTVAGLVDLKTREVPDYISYSFIAIALALRVAWFVFNQNIMIIAMVPIAFIFLVGMSYLLYLTGQWGGGDVKVMMGASIALAWFSPEGFPFFVDFVMNLLIVGAVYGLLFTMIIGLKNFKKFKKKLSVYDLLVIPGVVGLVFVSGLLPGSMKILAILLGLLVFSIRYVRIIEKDLMELKVPIKNLTEGDWLVSNIRYKNKTIIKKNNIGLTQSDLKKLKKFKNKIKKVKIKIGVPFVPAFLLTLITTLLFGNLLIYFIVF